jgi:hypothetical protein
MSGAPGLPERCLKHTDHRRQSVTAAHPNDRSLALLVEVELAGRRRDPQGGAGTRVVVEPVRHNPQGVRISLFLVLLLWKLPARNVYNQAGREVEPRLNVIHEHIFGIVGMRTEALQTEPLDNCVLGV